MGVHNSMRSISSEPISDFGLWTCKAIRFQILLLIGMSMAIFGLFRGSLSMALVCLIKQNSTTSAVAAACNESAFQVEWTGEEQARIHTSYYIGALVSVFLAGDAVKRFGAKNVLSFGVLLNVLGSFLTPFFIIFLRSYYYVIAIRIIMGFGNGFLIPCGSFLISKWFPINEKSTAMAIFTTGNQLGIAGSMFFTAKFCQLNVIGGWPLAFILYGVLGMLFLVLWTFIGADKPRNSNYISASELEYISGRREKRKRTDTIMVATPYRKIFLSPCVFVICLCSFAQSFIIVGLVTYLPRYYQLALQLSLTDNGIWSSIPFFVQMITKIMFGMGADFLKKHKISATLITKMSNAIASFGTAICIIGISLLPAGNNFFVMFLMCLSMGLLSGYVSGYNTSIVTVAPQFTAFISSYAQIYGQAASTVAPYILGSMTNEGTVGEWKLVFYLLAIILIVSGITFQVWGHGRTESWGEVSSTNPSIRLSTISLTPSCEAIRHKSSNIDQLNAQLLAEKTPSRRSPKVSYSISKLEEEVTYPMLNNRIEDLENDCIVEEDE